MSTLLHAALYGLGAFYALFGFVVIRRAIQPSCRNCTFWQDCMHEHLAFAATRGTRLPKVLICEHD
jgi:hypothetical protein